jgi:acetyltransferase-like isoleucine patch superfamily enzyme
MPSFKVQKEENMRLRSPIRWLTAIVYYFYNNFVTHIPVYCIRHFYLRSVLGIAIGKNTAVHMGCFFTGRKITIGTNTVINRNCYLDGRIGITIGNNVSLSPETCILSLGHDPQSIDFATTGDTVVLSDYVWTGMRTTILPGVRLGKGCITGACSVVTASAADFIIVAGNPAKIIGHRPHDLRYTISYFPFFDTDILPHEE